MKEKRRKIDEIGQKLVELLGVAIILLSPYLVSMKFFSMRKLDMMHCTMSGHPKNMNNVLLYSLKRFDSYRLGTDNDC